MLLKIFLTQVDGSAYTATIFILETYYETAFLAPIGPLSLVL